jgi:hypothetical protein
MADDLLVIVPCGSAKIWKKHPDRGPTPARDAYIGSPFKVNREFAERHADRWVILSAKYGFIDPDYVIPESYEVTFTRRSTNPIAYERLAEQVREQGLGRYARIIGLGGKDYRAAIRAAFDGLDARLEFPTAGMKLGESLGFLKSYDPRGEGDAAAFSGADPHG